MRQTIAVTGGSGKLGTYVIEELLRRQYKVISLDHRISSQLRCPQIQVDMNDLGQVVSALQGADAVLHLAAIPAPVGYPQHKIFSNNVLGGFHVLEAASLLGMNKVVMGSSTSCYGMAWAPHPISPLYLPIDEEHPQLTQEGYGLSKTINELTAAMYARRSALQVISLRFSLIAAPEEYGRMEEALRTPESFKKILWSYVDIRDAVQACIAALETEVEGAITLNITGDDTLSTLETSELLQACYPEVTDIRENLTERAPLFSNRLAKQVLHWHPCHRWEEGLEA